MVGEKRAVISDGGSGIAHRHFSRPRFFETARRGAGVTDLGSSSVPTVTRDLIFAPDSQGHPPPPMRNAWLTVRRRGAEFGLAGTIRCCLICLHRLLWPSPVWSVDEPPAVPRPGQKGFAASDRSLAIFWHWPHRTWRGPVVLFRTRRSSCSQKCSPDLSPQRRPRLRRITSLRSTQLGTHGSMSAGAPAGA